MSADEWRTELIQFYANSKCGEEEGKYVETVFKEALRQVQTLNGGQDDRRTLTRLLWSYAIYGRYEFFKLVACTLTVITLYRNPADALLESALSAYSETSRTGLINSNIIPSLVEKLGVAWSNPMGLVDTVQNPGLVGTIIKYGRLCALIFHC